jgi:hypothetical protein
MIPRRPVSAWERMWGKQLVFHWTALRRLQERRRHAVAIREVHSVAPETMALARAPGERWRSTFWALGVFSFHRHRRRKSRRERPARTEDLSRRPLQLRVCDVYTESIPNMLSDIDPVKTVTGSYRSHGNQLNAQAEQRPFGGADGQHGAEPERGFVHSVVSRLWRGGSRRPASVNVTGRAGSGGTERDLPTTARQLSRSRYCFTKSQPTSAM